MCSIFGPIMDNYQGDLTDIVRASGGEYGSCSTGTSSSEAAPLSDWHQFSSNPINFSSVMEDPRVNFGDPFSNMRDPFLHELDLPGSAYFSATNSAEMISSGGIEEAAGFSLGVSSCATSVLPQQILEDDMRRPCNNIFSHMSQISPNTRLPVSPRDSPAMAASPRGIKPSAVVSGNIINVNSSKDCLVDNTGVQISSPRNPSLKRRKSQAKKVVCIPAPAAANNRPSSGEVVPSDLWAWRKYGQKPIKGSPYPRGYYRCSSSKGCSARKQVERSRTDPNLLVITYTSEHNHPWPTQRNALAGSTRSQPSKNNNATSKNSEALQPQNGMTKAKEEQQESNTSDSHVSPVVAGNSATSTSVKEEIEDMEKNLEMEDGEFSDGLPYKPSMPECNESEDFFAELGELEADPLNLLFTQGFNVTDEQRESKALDPFHLFDWSSGDNTNKTSFEGPKRGL